MPCEKLTLRPNQFYGWTGDITKSKNRLRALPAPVPCTILASCRLHPSVPTMPSSPDHYRSLVPIYCKPTCRYISYAFPLPPVALMVTTPPNILSEPPRPHRHPACYGPRRLSTSSHGFIISPFPCPGSKAR